MYNFDDYKRYINNKIRIEFSNIKRRLNYFKFIICMLIKIK